MPYALNAEVPGSPEALEPLLKLLNPFEPEAQVVWVPRPGAWRRTSGRRAAKRARHAVPSPCRGLERGFRNLGGLWDVQAYRLKELDRGETIYSDLSRTGGGSMAGAMLRQLPCSAPGAVRGQGSSCLLATSKGH